MNLLSSRLGLTVTAAMLLALGGQVPADASLTVDDADTSLVPAAGDLLIERGADEATSVDEHLLALLGRVTGGGANAPLSGSVTFGPDKGAVEPLLSDESVHFSAIISARTPMGSSYTGLGNSAQLIRGALEQSAAYVAESRHLQPPSAPQASLRAVISTGGGGYLPPPSISVAGSSPMAVTQTEIIFAGSSGNDIEQIPLPAAAYLLGSGLLAMAGLRRKLKEPTA